ncbi:MAG: portal protein [Sideroxydans sp.]|nr:portal protein [Sideroxydans sp.]
MSNITKEKLYTRWGQLKTERATWYPHWKELSDFLLPRSGRFFIQDRNRGMRKHNSIYDNTGTRALRVLGAGMMSGATSPARPWFRLSTSDPDLAKYGPVKVWLNDVTVMMQRVFEQSNTYRSLHSMYEELGAFGTGAAIILPDYDNVIHHYPLTIGEYCIATDYQGRVNTLFREYQKTVHEVVAEFGLENCSSAVQSLYSSGSLDKWVTIIHAIEPRKDRDTTKKDAKNMAYLSNHFEVGGEKDKFLRESGFESFPAVAPRWATVGGDIYGNSPGMEALGDIKQLQHEQLRKAQGIDYMTKPPLQMPTSMVNRDVDTLPGGVSFVDMNNPHGGIKTAFEVRLDLNHLLMDIQDVRERVRGSFYADLFLMLANQTDARMTATEVAERHEEKLLMLGPVLERLHNELLNPLVEMTFERMVKANILPPAPPEMQGKELNIEFVSMLAQAQKAVGTNSIDRFVSNLGAVAQFKPDVLDKFNSDEWADIYADSLGVNPNLIVAGDKVAIVRNQRAQQAQQAQQAQLMEQAASTAQKAAAAGGGGPQGLSNIMTGLTGYGTPGA